MYMLSDIAKRGLWTQEDVNGSAELTALFESGIIARSPQIRRKVESGDAGDLIEIPFIQEEQYSEPNISDDSSTPLPWESISKEKMTALLGNYNKGWKAFDIARQLDSGNDAFDVMQSLIGRYWVKDINHRMANIANGVLASNVVSGGSLFHDQTGTPWEYNMIVDTNNLRGDAGFKGHDFMFMHSSAYSAIKKVDAGRVRAILDTSTNKPIYHLYDEKSIIIIDDVMPFDGTSATIMLADGGAFVYEESGDVVEALEYVRDSTTGNGGGAEGIITRKRYLLHVNGWSFTGAVMASSTGATLAELQDASNWELKVDVKQSPVSFLKFDV